MVDVDDEVWDVFTRQVQRMGGTCILHVEEAIIAGVDLPYPDTTVEMRSGYAYTRDRRDTRIVTNEDLVAFGPRFLATPESDRPAPTLRELEDALIPARDTLGIHPSLAITRLTKLGILRETQTKNRYYEIPHVYLLGFKIGRYEGIDKV